MRRFCWAVLVLIIAGACKPKIPADIIQPDRMGAILYDIHLVDGYITTIPNQDTAKKTGAAYYRGVYQKYGIDSAVYAKSMTFYYDHPAALSEMYVGVTAKLKKSKDSVDKIQTIRLRKEAAAKKLKQDSLEKADPTFKAKQAAAEKSKKDSLAAKAKLERIEAVKAAKKDSIARVKRNITGAEAAYNVKKDSANKAKLKSKKAGATKKVQ